ncbi:hypothetical protein PybrP1_006916 [[Pythium] brassicae (nom. inval.)]|nr:hypothetical protein PybrP1_006916 [[Pythium] brassicae (nom. inval.)]
MAHTAWLLRVVRMRVRQSWLRLRRQAAERALLQQCAATLSVLGDCCPKCRWTLRGATARRRRLCSGCISARQATKRPRSGLRVATSSLSAARKAAIAALTERRHAQAGD